MTPLRRIHYKVPGISADDATIVLGRHWGWIFSIGVTFVVIGMFAVLLPIISTVGITLALAAIFFATGFIHLIQALKLRHEQGGILRFVQSILGVIAGGLIFMYPGIGMLGISLLLSFYFFVGATVQWILARAMAPTRVRTWLNFGAAASFMLGLYIAFTFPLSAAWVPGTLLGVEFLFNGISLVGFALVVRRLFLDAKGIERDAPPFWSSSHQPNI